MKKCCTTLSLVFLLASCNADEYININQLEEQNEVNHSIKSKTNYSGRELFESIYFGATDLDIDTEYFHLLKEFRETLSVEEREALLETSNRINSEIENIDETFFNNFKESLYTKDYYIIEEQFKNADIIVEEAVKRIPEFSEPYSRYKEITRLVSLADYIDDAGILDEERLLYDLEHEHNYDVKFITPTIIAIGVAAALGVTVLVAVNYGVVINVGVAVYGKVWTPWDKQIKKHFNRLVKSSSMQNEMFINDLVNEI